MTGGGPKKSNAQCLSVKVNENVQLAGKTNSNDIPNVDGQHRNSAEDTERVVRGLGSGYWASERRQSCIRHEDLQMLMRAQMRLLVRMATYGGNRVENGFDDRFVKKQQDEPHRRRRSGPTAP